MKVKRYTREIKSILVRFVVKLHIFNLLILTNFTFHDRGKPVYFISILRYIARVNTNIASLVCKRLLIDPDYAVFNQLLNSSTETFFCLDLRLDLGKC